MIYFYTGRTLVVLLTKATFKAVRAESRFLELCQIAIND